MYQDFLPFKDMYTYNIPVCVYISYIVNLFICQRALELLLPLGYEYGY